MPKSYLFYDLETSGLNPCFDQILQFASIRTDSNLNELERNNIFIKLKPDTIPNPSAMMTHQIPIERLNEYGINEIEAIKKIHALFNTPGTISIGYNSLGFDDEFLRFSFYRNLLSPYTHQYACNCSRMDLYPVAALYYLFKNEALKWPEKDKAGSLKLEFLSSANNLQFGNSHDAMNDTQSTLSLARIFYREKEMWDYVCGYFDKNIDLTRMKQLPTAFNLNDQNYKEAIIVDGKFGIGQFYQCPVLCIGPHNHYQNQLLWLKLDDDNLSTTTDNNINNTTHIYRKKAGETGILLPPSPRFNRYLSSKRVKLAEQNKYWLQKNPHKLSLIVDYHREYKYPVIPNTDTDAALYQIDFLKPYEERLCQKFHTENIDGKISLLNEFTNDNLLARAIRILGRNYSDQLPLEFAEHYNTYLERVKSDDINFPILDYRGEKHLTKKAALDKICKLRAEENLNTKQLQLLKELEEYLN